MSWFDKYCEKCSMKLDKKTAPQRFGKYFCSEEHAEEYASDIENKRKYDYDRDSYKNRRDDHRALH